jgi:serine/threonine protein kinase
LVRKIDCFWFFLPFDTNFSIAISYLETQKKVHRDISYTNILLQETDDSDVGRAAQATRTKVMHEFGLSEIDELRKQLNCREGLLIDFDYGATLAASGEKTASDEKEEETDSGKKQGETSPSGNFKPSGPRTVS